MILVVTISIALGVLLLIKLLIDSSYIAAILLVILFLIGWFIFNAFFGLTVFIKSNMRIYFASRIRGGSHEWAMRRVIESRYSISREKRDYVKLNILDKFSLDQSEEYQLKVLVYKLLCYEHKPPPTAYVSEEIQKQIDNIYDSLRKKYAFKGKEIDLKKDAKAYFDQGISCINDKQDWDLAMAEFDKALSIDPDYAEAYIARGNCWYFAGDHEQAMSDYSRAIKVNPNFYGAYSRRASLLSERGDLDGSISDMTKVIELNPGNAASYWGRAGGYRRKGEFDQAANDYIKAIDIDPNIADIHFSSGNYNSENDLLNRKLSDYVKIMPDEIEKSISTGIKKGFLTIDEVYDLVPSNITSPEQIVIVIEIIFHLLGKIHIDFIDTDTGKKIETSDPIWRMIKKTRK